MEVKSLIVGLVFSVGIFALKSGAGLSFLLRKSGIRRQVGAIVGYAAAYSLVFAGVWLVGRRFDVMANFDRWMFIFRNGMSIHLLLAMLLMSWGLVLLRRDACGNCHGWLLLTLPCPVCLSVIFLAGAFLENLLPDNPWCFLWFATGFIVLAIAAGLILSRWEGQNTNHDLGYVMLLAAAYFLVTIAVVPQVNDLGRIYRLGRNSPSLPVKHLTSFMAGLLCAWGIGFIHSLRKRSWK